MTGIGMHAAKRATDRLLDAMPVDRVLVVGIAGDVGPSRVGGAPARGTLATSDEFLVDPATLEHLARDGVIALDMETSAVAAVCEARGTPWSVVRAISDRTDDHPDDAVLGLAKPDGSPNLPAAARFVLAHPWRVPQLARLARDARAAATSAAHTCASPRRGRGPDTPIGS